MTIFKEKLIDRMIHIYGFKHECVIEFARLCESNFVDEKYLETIVKCHEEILNN